MTTSVQNFQNVQFQGLPQDVQDGGHLAPAPQNQGTNSLSSQLYDIASYLGNGGLQLASQGLNGGLQLVNGGIQLVSNGINSGVQMASNGINSGIQLASDGAQLVSDGINSGVQMVSDGINSGVQLVSDGAQLVSNGVSSGVQMIGNGLSSGKQIAVNQGTKAFESGFGTTSALLSGALRQLPYTDSQSSLVGRLPNNPDFNGAIANPNGLSAQFTAVSNQNNLSGHSLQMLENAVTGGNSLHRHGQQIQLTPQEFHAALLRGAHFVVEDGGTLTDNLQQQGGFTARGSSHYKGSQDQQYGLDLPNHLGHLLIGKDLQGHSFFQLESHGTGNAQQSLSEKISSVLGHTQAYLQHVGSSLSYVQIGPQGCIEGSEKDNNHVIVR
ncbi:hypothetical protein [Chitinimonas lacunae]|uniref:Uncharacterized protein n=1 Tax=Chitinimonas lacunae TaxID=1963018 RepID=A0ABV8MPR4_9NEIS